MDAAVREQEAGISAMGWDEPLDPNGQLERHPLTQVRAALRLVHAAFWLGLVLASFRFQKILVACARLSRVGESAAARRWERVHETNARRIFRAATRLSGVWVKLGQVASTLGSFLPTAYTRELAKLQDRVPPRPFSEIDEALFRAYGRPHQVVFADLEPRPIAAASLGQVHRATTFDGRVVAVKVLYPEVRATLRADLVVLGWTLELLRKAYPINDLDRLHRSMAGMLERETDLRLEARALRRMARCFAGDATVSVPEVDLELTNDRVLVMGFVEGARITDDAALARLGVTKADAVRALLDSFFKQLFSHRFFHADPHPGNFLVQRGENGRPRIMLLDLGATAEVGEHVVDGLMNVVAGLFGKDDERVVRGLERVGFLEPGRRDEALVSELRSAIGRMMGAGDLREVAARVADGAPDAKATRTLLRSVSYPEGWFEVERSLTMLFGICAQEAPQLDPARVAFPHVARWMAAAPR